MFLIFQIGSYWFNFNDNKNKFRIRLYFWPVNNPRNFKPIFSPNATYSTVLHVGMRVPTRRLVPLCTY